MKIFDEWKKKTDEGSDKSFFNEYLEKEMSAYIDILAEGSGSLKGSCGELAEKFDMEPAVFGGFLDGINTSLKEELELEALTETSQITAEINFERLLYNTIELGGTIYYKHTLSFALNRGKADFPSRKIAYCSFCSYEAVINTHLPVTPVKV